jgi:hypothetical protein
MLRLNIIIKNVIDIIKPNYYMKPFDFVSLFLY